MLLFDMCFAYIHRICICMYIYIYGYVYVFYCLIDEFDVFVHMYIYIYAQYIYIYVIYRNKTYHIKPSISLYNTYVYIYIIQHMSTDVFKNWTGQDGSHFLTRPVFIARISASFVGGYNELVHVFCFKPRNTSTGIFTCVSSLGCLPII